MQKEYLMKRLTATLSIIAIVFLVAGPAISAAPQQDVEALKQQLADKDAQIAALQQDVEALKQQFAALEGNYSDLQTQIADIQQRCCPQQVMEGMEEKSNTTTDHQQVMNKIEQRLNMTGGHQQVMNKIEKKLKATGRGLNLTFGHLGKQQSLLSN